MHQEYSFKEITLDQLPQVAEYLEQTSRHQPIILVDGEMGAGKTTLISLVCEKLGSIDTPSSPTYSIVNTYQTKNNGEVYHFDFYRLKDEAEAIQSGLDELIYSGKICFIEWGEKIAKLLPENYVRVTIEKISDDKRNILITTIFD
jgi:tRNA threonylcarbamoyladenosine biosynthesis protein TsaE